MTRFRVMLAAALLAGSVGGAGAQTMSYADAAGMLAKSCGKDIQKFCPTVNLGGGALVDCMDKNITKVNAQCKADYAAAEASIAKRQAAQVNIIKVCNADVARLCPGMVPQDGNLLSCLLEATKVVSAACNQTITDAGYR
ncbi:cysteine rich repeat-containing protein [Xanthobacter sp. VNH20]|uniref:cysteine rich repeat-containing protein n=1 Tax=Xanthobacter sp. VNH20 TaxID=3156616 RepID=UPI0032B3C292